MVKQELEGLMEPLESEAHPETRDLRVQLVR